MRRLVLAGLVLAGVLSGASACPEDRGSEGEPVCVNEDGQRVPCPNEWTAPEPTPLPRPYGVPERIWQ